MTSDPWRFFHEAPDAQPMVLRGAAVFSANDVRFEAARIRRLLTGASEPVFLYCEDAGNFLAGLIGALSAGRDLLLPGHAAPGYLCEIGATGRHLLTDVPALDAEATIVRLDVTPGKCADMVMPVGSAQIGFFTSGSTGEPKPCMKSVRQLFSEVEVHLKLWGAPQGPVIGTVSHQHIYGLLFRIFWPLMAGKPISALRQEMWEAVAHFVRPGSSLISSPAHLSRIPESFALPHRPDFIFSSGGPLSIEASHDAFAKLGRYPIEVLGSTETGGVAWRSQKEHAALWMPLPEVEIRRGDEGTLSVRSPFAGGSDFISMGDGVTLAPNGGFSLQPRLDRTVKIEGKRVSLPRVEEALRVLPGIADASAVDLPDRDGALGAVIVLSPEGAREVEELGKFRYSRRLRQVLAERLEPMERPRLWRFVAQIPENAQGKRAVAALRGLFADAPSDIPTIKRREVNESGALFDLELDPDLRWFDGHFPGRPILPGVAQLHIASVLAEDVWGVVATGSEMSRVKFRRVMQPGDLVTLSLARNGDDRIDFRYFQDNEVMASGALKGIER